MLGTALAILGAALAVFGGGIGSSIGVGIAGQAATGLLSEQPEKFGNLLLLVAIPGTQGIYGFLAGFMVISKLGLLGGNPIRPEVYQGVQILFACLPAAVNELISGIHQGKVAASGIGMVAKRAEEAGRALILAALVETYAILGLLSTILLLNGIKL
ncbi:MAG: V-type ATP synthase subunit K [bacterium]